MGVRKRPCEAFGREVQVEKQPFFLSIARGIGVCKAHLFNMVRGNIETTKRGIDHASSMPEEYVPAGEWYLSVPSAFGCGISTLRVEGCDPWKL